MPKKIITVPKDKETEQALDYDYAMPEQLVELELTAEAFDKLWNNGGFSLIDKISGTIIDEFEEEHITNLDTVDKVLEALRESRHCPENVINMFEQALAYKTRIHFYF